MTQRQPSHDATDSVAARAIALVDIGYSPEWVGPRAGVSGRTVRRWVDRSREVAKGNQAVMDKWVKRTLQAQDLLEDALDTIEDEGSALKHLRDVTVAAGVGTDKLQKEHTPTSIQADKVLIILNAERPVIEGEVVEHD